MAQMFQNFSFQHVPDNSGLGYPAHPNAMPMGTPYGPMHVSSVPYGYQAPMIQQFPQVCFLSRLISEWCVVAEGENMFISGIIGQNEFQVCSNTLSTPSCQWWEGVEGSLLAGHVWECINAIWIPADPSATVCPLPSRLRGSLCLHANAYQWSHATLWRPAGGPEHDAIQPLPATLHATTGAISTQIKISDRLKISLYRWLCRLLAALLETSPEMKQDFSVAFHPHLHVKAIIHVLLQPTDLPAM